MAAQTVHILPILQNNYVYVVVEDATRHAIIVDPGVADSVLKFVTQHGLNVTHILNTHHHRDHVGGNQAVQRATGCEIIGFGPDAARLPGITQYVQDGERLFLLGREWEVIHTPGHTLGHVCYYCAEEAVAFVGDTLFVMGCGRLFEGTSEQMYRSLQRLNQLPPETQLYSAHEYTLDNAAFARSVEPGNVKLKQREKECQTLRAAGMPTQPTTLLQERETNPFLRVHSVEIRQHLGMENAESADVFAILRAKKDQF